MTLEELIRTHANARFCLKVYGISPDSLRVIVHPDGEDGTTLDYQVRGDELIQILQTHCPT
jgi:hypothetical protein